MPALNTFRIKLDILCCGPEWVVTEWVNGGQQWSEDWFYRISMCLFFPPPAFFQFLSVIRGQSEATQLSKALHGGPSDWNGQWFHQQTWKGLPNSFSNLQNIQNWWCFVCVYACVCVTMCVCMSLCVCLCVCWESNKITAGASNYCRSSPYSQSW